MTRSRGIRTVIDPARLRAEWSNPDLTVAQIADRLGVQRTSVSSAARRYNLPSRKVESAVDPDTLPDQWADATLSINDIARIHGVAAASIARAARRLALGPRPEPPPVEGAPARTPWVDDAPVELEGGRWVPGARGVLRWEWDDNEDAVA